MTSTATIVANSPGNFIIEANGAFHSQALRKHVFPDSTLHDVFSDSTLYKYSVFFEFDSALHKHSVFSALNIPTRVAPC